MRISLGRQQPVGAERVLGIELLGRLQVRGGVRPAFLVIALPLHLVVEPLDLPHAVLAHVVVLVDARFHELLRHHLFARVLEIVVPAAEQHAAEAALGGLPVGRDGDHVLHLEVVEQQPVDRPRLAAGEAPWIQSP